MGGCRSAEARSARGTRSASEKNQAKSFATRCACRARRAVRIAGCGTGDAAGNFVAAGNGDGNGAAIREERRAASDFSNIISTRALLVCCLRVELLPFADDRGPVDKNSSGFVHGSAGIGIAFRAAGGDAADWCAAGGAGVALGENDGSFARGGMVKDKRGGSNAGRDLQRKQHA